MISDNSRQELVSNLKDQLGKIKKSKKEVDKLKVLLGESGILPGRAQNLINNLEEINSLSIEELYVYASKTHALKQVDSLNIENYFTKREIKELNNTEVNDSEEVLTFPYTFTNVLKVNDSYYFSIDVTTLRLLNEGKEIQYNPNTQRNVKYVRSTEDTLIETPTLNKKSVTAMRELFRKGELIDSILIFNARLGTADEGIEVFYDEDSKELTITKGTMFDCLDGFHRFVSVTSEQAENKELNMDLMIKVINVSEKEAKKHFTQTNTINPIPKSHKKRMDEENLASFIVNRINKESELKGKISSDQSLKGMLTTYNLLAEGIEKGFDIKNRSEAISIGNYIIETLDNVSYKYPEILGEFDKADQNLMFKGFFWRSLMVFIGEAKKRDLSPEQATRLISKVDFSYNNKSWQDIKVLNGDRLSSNPKISMDKFMVSLFASEKVEN